MNFKEKMNFEPQTVQFVDKVYTVKTDHKTGLLFNELVREKPEDLDEKTIKLLLGEKQAEELRQELEAKGGNNYFQNQNVIVFALMAAMTGKPYEEFEKAAENASKNV